MTTLRSANGQMTTLENRSLTGLYSQGKHQVGEQDLFLMLQVLIFLFYIDPLSLTVRNVPLNNHPDRIEENYFKQSLIY